MPVPFGFSAGDFVNVLSLITKVVTSLRSVRGASFQYQQAILELEILARTLQQIEAFKPYECNLSHVNAIRGVVLACQLPLREFLAKAAKYNSSLAGGAVQRPSFIRSSVRKVQWAVFEENEVAKLRAVVAAKVVSLNIMMANLSLEYSQRIESLGKDTYSTLQSGFRDTSKQLDTIEMKVDQAHRSIFAGEVENATSRTAIYHEVKKVETLTSQLMATRHQEDHRLSQVLVATQQTRDNVNELMKYAENVLFTKLPQGEIRDLLSKIFQINLDMFSSLRTTQGNIAPQPTMTLEEDIILEDALGRKTNLTYQHFRFREVLEAFLRCKFKGMPGELNVKHGRFMILPPRTNDGSKFVLRTWEQSVFPGQRLCMSMVMAQLSSDHGHCPRPSCLATIESQVVDGMSTTCGECGLCFWLVPQTQNLSSMVLEPGEGTFSEGSREMEYLESEAFRRIHFQKSRLLAEEADTTPDAEGTVPVWFCPSCGYGPLDTQIDTACPNCGWYPKSR